MKQAIILLYIVGFLGCAKSLESTVTAKNGSSCTVEKTTAGAIIKCDDGTFSEIKNGSDGKDGKNGAVGATGSSGATGAAGASGASCTTQQTNTGIKVTCGATTSLISNGQSCSVQQASNGAIVTCGSSSAVILNGKDAAPSTSIGIASYVYPCGKNEFANDEIFLRLTDGNLLGLYDGGPNLDRLALLSPGNYVTSDRDGCKKCYFTITNDLKITNERVQ